MAQTIEPPLEGQTNNVKPLVSIYWDCQNVPVNLYLPRYLLIYANKAGSLDKKRAYSNWRQENLAAEQRLHELGFDCIDVPLNTKNSVDKKLIADCSCDFVKQPSSQVFILVTGDGDFIPLVKDLREREKKVIIFAQRGNGSKKLVALANEFYPVDEKLPELVEEDFQPQLISYLDAIECLIQSIKAAQTQHKNTTFAYIDNLMRQNLPNYRGVSSIRKPDGNSFRRFSAFVNAVAKEGKVKVQTVGQSQTLLLI